MATIKRQQRTIQQRKIREGIAAQLANLKVILPPEIWCYKRDTKHNLLFSSAQYMQQLQRENVHLRIKLNQIHQILNVTDYHIRVLNEQVTELTLRNSISQIIPFGSTTHPEIDRPETLIADQSDKPLNLSVK